MDETFPYLASLTGEPFLFFELRTMARLFNEGLDKEQVFRVISDENLFQYPTEKSISKIFNVCYRRIKALDNPYLLRILSEQPVYVAKQVALYALMRQNRLVWEFMISVVGEKFRSKNSAFGKIDINSFFLRLQEQNDKVASWSDITIGKLKQVMVKMLVETEYLDDIQSTHINSVLLDPAVEQGIRENGDYAALAAFNCFE